MPQSILAILALMLATTFALQQQRNTVRTRAQMVRNEIALQGTGVAESVLGEIGTKAFDQATEPLDPGDAITSYTDLTPESHFDGSSARTTIEDYHDQTLMRPRTFRGETLNFTVHVEVAYVKDDQETPATHQTKNKMATVTVRSQDINDPVEVEISSTYNCNSKCDWS